MQKQKKSRPSTRTINLQDLRHVVVAGVRQRDGHRVQVLPEEQLQLRGGVPLPQPQQRISVRQYEGEPFSRPPHGSAAGVDSRLRVTPLALGGGRGAEIVQVQLLGSAWVFHGHACTGMAVLV